MADVWTGIANEYVRLDAPDIGYCYVVQLLSLVEL